MKNEGYSKNIVTSAIWAINLKNDLQTVGDLLILQERISS
jgi:hypothetical protein